jgi:hypothetical protein
MDRLVFVPRQRKKLLTWSFWSGVVAVVAAVVVSPVGQPVQFRRLLALPGAVGLLLCLVTLWRGSAKTVLSPEGIRTSTVFRRRVRRWSDIVDITTLTRQGRGASSTFIVVHTAEGHLTLPAPFDSTNGRDPEFSAKTARIRMYWAEHRSL